MKLSEYVTPARIIYYAAIAIVALLVRAVTESMTGQPGTTAALFVLMWLLLVIDFKFVPTRLSLLRPFLPGFAWLDLWVALVLYAGLAFLSYGINQAVGQRDFIIQFLLIMGVCFGIGLFGLLRWQRWRGQRSVT